MYENILAHLKTKNDLDKFKPQVDILIDSYYLNSDKGFYDTLTSRINYELAEEIGKEIADSKTAVEDYLVGLKLKLNSIKLISLTVGFEPSSQTISRISDYLRQNISGEIIIDLFYEPRIVGGAIIEYMGKYADLSLLSLFNQESEKHKEA